MAHTVKGRQLTETHRQTQVALQASLVERIMDIFLSTFRPADIDGSSKDFIRAALPLVMEARDLSTELATTYLDAFRKAELKGLVDHAELAPDVTDPLSVPIDTLQAWRDADLVTETMDLELASVESLVKDLHTSGAGVAKREIGKGKTPEAAKQTAAKAVSAKAMKLAADGGRAPLIREVSTGRGGAIGYVRVVDANPCPFCAMLASRGAVYRSDAFSHSNALFSGDGEFKVHDGCGCTLEPVYGKRVTDLPKANQELAEQWAEIAAGARDPWNTWRRYKRSGTIPDPDGGNDKVAPSAPQYGRAKAPKKGRKSIGELDLEALQKTYAGMLIRRSGLESQLADLEARGQSVKEPGPAQTIAAQLKRLEANIRHAERRMAKLSTK